MTSEPPVDLNESPPPPAAPAVEGEIQPRPRFPWRLFFLLAVMMLAASVLIVPYVIQLSSISNQQMANQVPQVIMSSIIQAVVLYFPLLLLGLFIARRLGLGAPYLQAVAERQLIPPGFRGLLIPTALVGFGMGGLLVLLSGLYARALPAELTSIPASHLPNAFQGFLASISAGINEEILLRLCLLSLVAWLIQYLAKRRSSGRPGAVILWTANVLAAVIFGLLHLPNLAAVNVPVTPVILAYIVLLNGLAGLGFGWLYWSFGLEAAMLAHFFADIVLHVITRLFA